jgi:DNA-directed RNA polymerase subunit RPC12/RpoP
MATMEIERLRFTCTRCGHRWISDFDVRTVEGDDGRTVDYFAFNGVLTTAPTAPGAATCPVCGSRRIQVRLIARRAVPELTWSVAAQLGSPTTVFRSAERRKAPLLRADNVPRDELG